MTKSVFTFPDVFISKKRARHVPVTLIAESKYKAWLDEQESFVKAQVKEQGFNPEDAQIMVLRDAKGKIVRIYGGVHDAPDIYDCAKIAEAIGKVFSKDALKTMSFEITGASAPDPAHAGWGLAAYRFETYKTEKHVAPTLLWSGKVNKARVKALVESICLLRNMINTPANDMGPDEMEAAARKVAGEFEAKIRVIKDKQLLVQNFPLVYAVGDSSPRRPRLIEITWGNTKHKKLTLVGKGVVFDTGGLNLKPGNYMELMKKDMGGAAHVLALARMIMALKLPVRLRVLMPVVENAVSGTSFRPGDVLKSRKGIYVENKNTDAEGRLILADCLTAASEDKPDLIVDFSTLTGSARAALGPDIPAMFSNDDKIAQALQKISMEEKDPLWRMPLWRPYNSLIRSSVGDIVNSVSQPGDLIYSALFLERFLVKSPHWVHIDCFAWENTGHAGRPKGAADTGLRAVFAFLEKRYSKKYFEPQRIL